MAESKSYKILKNAVKAIEKTGKGLNTDEFLDFHLKNNCLRSAVSDILFKYYRNRVFLENIFNDFSRGRTKKNVKNVLFAAMVQILFQSGINSPSAVNIATEFTKRKFGRKTASFINGFLRNIIRRKKNLIKYTPSSPLPSLILKKWKDFLNEKQINLFSDLFSKEAQITFRFKKNKADKNLKDISEELFIEDFMTPCRFYSSENSYEIINSAPIKKNNIYIQDPAASASIPLLANLKNFDFILDICAAPGGKSRLISEYLNFKDFIISDKSLKRQQITAANFAENSKKASIITSSALAAPFIENSFDLVFADVPCTNTGTFRRRPDVLWNFSYRKMKELTNLQNKILTSAGKLVKKNGYLLYSTCSIEKEENSSMIKNFLKEHKDFKKIREIPILPAEHHDGGYTALLKKIKLT